MPLGKMDLDWDPDRRSAFNATVCDSGVRSSPGDCAEASIAALHWGGNRCGGGDRHPSGDSLVRTGHRRSSWGPAHRRISIPFSTSCTSTDQPCTHFRGECRLCWHWYSRGGRYRATRARHIKARASDICDGDRPHVSSGLRSQFLGLLHDGCGGYARNP